MGVPNCSWSSSLLETVETKLIFIHKVLPQFSPQLPSHSGSHYSPFGRPSRVCTLAFSFFSGLSGPATENGKTRKLGSTPQLWRYPYLFLVQIRVLCQRTEFLRILDSPGSSLLSKEIELEEPFLLLHWPFISQAQFCWEEGHLFVDWGILVVSKLYIASLHNFSKTQAYACNVCAI